MKNNTISNYFVKENFYKISLRPPRNSLRSLRENKE